MGLIGRSFQQLRGPYDVVGRIRWLVYALAEAGTMDSTEIEIAVPDIISRKVEHSFTEPAKIHLLMTYEGIQDKMLLEAFKTDRGIFS